jgi:hypothetical protein
VSNFVFVVRHVKRLVVVGGHESHCGFGGVWVRCLHFMEYVFRIGFPHILLLSLSLSYCFSLIFRLKLKVNKLTSTHSLYPRDYYSLPFCRPPLIEQEGENLGEFLAGDKIENSPYTLSMMKDVYCQEVCTANLGRGEHRGTSPNKAVAAIRQEYHNNWIVDGLNAASKTEDEKTVSTNYHEGFLIGFVADDNLKAYSTFLVQHPFILVASL